MTREVLAALAFAADRHRDQRRKDSRQTPYINHVIDVTSILANEGGVNDTVVLVAAALHDTVEDTVTTIDELEERFGREVRDVVAECTDDKRLPKQVRKSLQIEHAAASTDRAKQVKIADKIANVRDLTHSPPADWTADRTREYFDWAARVVTGLRGVNAALDAAFDRALAAARASRVSKNHL
jgi:guanosine-3',5'-bis(diphosphate) 3'-pyrophosphohydrolase